MPGVSYGLRFTWLAAPAILCLLGSICAAR